MSHESQQLQHAGRKRKQQEMIFQDDDEISSNPGSSGRSSGRAETFSHRWLDDGTEVAEDHRTEHDVVELLMDGKLIRIEKGDNVKLWNADSSGTWQSDWCARVESMWEESSPSSSDNNSDSSTICKFRARWFYKRKDIEKLDRGDFSGQRMSRDDLLDAMGPKDLVLTSEMDDNGLQTIGGKIQVFSRRPEDDVPDDDDDEIPQGAYFCRYGLSLGTKEPRKLVILPYEGVNDELTTSTQQQPQPQQPAPISRTQGTSSDNDGSSVSSTNEYQNSDGVPETEGSTTKSDIRLGPQHQVEVPAYDPENAVPLERLPTQVWRPNNGITSEDMDDYLARASAILTPYAQHNNLTMDEPFTTIPADELEKLMKRQQEQGGAGFSERKVPLVMSAISTASTMSSGTKKNALVRECNLDLVLELLHEKNYDVSAALDAMEANPADYIEAWTKTEKELFDVGFRRYSGSLRMIGNTVGPSRTFKEVVDFHYRVKIPDQFRKYQEKKREQAVRIVECIEARKFNDSVIHGHMEQSRFGGSNNNNGDQGDSKRGRITYNWTETGTKDVIGVVEEKRLAAKELLLDIEKTMGRDKMSEVASAIMTLHQEPENNIRIDFEDMLKDNPEILKRLNHFLPAKLRN